MAGKFRIFCDESPRPTLEPDEKPMILSQPQQSQQQQQQQQIQRAISNQQAIKTTNSYSNNNTNNEQEKLAVFNKLAGNAPQPLKREPLGLRQALSVTNSVQVEPPTSSSLTASSSSVTEEDQENDISMASLGSDFIPSILQSDEFDENSYEDSYGNEGNLTGYQNASYIDYADDDDDYAIEEEEDEALRLELSKAFKQHDDSQLTKSTVYINDIKEYLYKLEREPELRALPNYMDFQNDIDTEKRSILINWLVEVADEYELESETLFICTNTIDRFLSKMSIPTSNFQLLGVAAMFMATKYEEVYPPNLYQFVEVTDETYSKKQITQMEQEILKTLNFRITHPTISFYLDQIFAYNKFTKKIYHMAQYLCYLSLLTDQPFLEYYPSEIALAAVILAAHQLDGAANISTELKEAYDRSNLDQLERRNLPDVELKDLDRKLYTLNKELPFCIESLRALQERARSPENSSQLSAVIQRFSTSERDFVSLLPAPKEEDLLSY